MTMREIDPPVTFMNGEGRFWRDANGDNWHSGAPEFAQRLAPAYIVVDTALRLVVEEGLNVTLPEGYDAEALANAKVALWRSSQGPVHVSPRQAEELGQIARTLREEHAEHLRDTWDYGWELWAVEAVLRAVRTGDSYLGTDDEEATPAN